MKVSTAYFLFSILLIVPYLPKWLVLILAICAITLSFISAYLEVSDEEYLASLKRNPTDDA